MATITGLTSARMLAIEAASVVSGVISGDDLILTKYDNSIINAGNVRGTQGIQGLTGGQGLTGDTGPAASTDGILPTVAPTVTVIAGVVDTVFVKMALYENPDPVEFRVYMSAVSGFVPGPENLYIQDKSSLITVTGLTAGTPYYFLVSAIDEDGEGPISAEQTETPIEIDLSAIETNIATLQTDLNTAEGKISTLETVTIPDLQTDLTTAEGSISTLNTVTIPALDTELTTAQADVITAQAAADAADAATKITGTGSTKTFLNVLNWTQAGGNIAGNIVIETPMTMSNYMFDIRIAGYNYSSGATDISLAATGYAYSSGVFVNTGVIYIGSMPCTVRFGLKAGKVVIILTPTSGLWQYPKIRIPQAFIGHSVAPDTFSTGWSASLILEADLATAGIASMVTPSVQNANETATAANDLVQAWRVPNTVQIAGGSLYADSVTSAQIAASAISANELAANAVTAVKIAAGAVTAGKIYAGSVTATEIAANAITANEIATGAITAIKIAANTITASELAANSVTASELAASSVIAGKIAANAVTATQIAANSVTAVKILAGAVVAGKIAANAVTATEIAANSITATEIAAGAIDAMTITGPLIRTAASGQRMEFATAGLVTYSTANAVTATLGTAAGGLSLTGNLSITGTGTISVTNPLGDGVKIIPDATYGGLIEFYDSSSLTGVIAGDVDGINIFTEGGYGIIFDSSSSTNFYSTAEIALESGTSVRSLSTAGKTTSGAANMYISSVNGIMYRSTSSARYKTDFRPLSLAVDAILGVESIEFHDKAEVERYANGETWEKIVPVLTRSGKQAIKDGKPVTEKIAVPYSAPKWYAGSTAEQVHAAGLGIFDTYDDEGEPDSVMYDHLIVATIPLLRQHHERIADTEVDSADLRTKLNQALTRITNLEGAAA